MTQTLSMTQILADESAPAAEMAVEQMNPDERAVLEETREAQTTGEDRSATPAEEAPEQTQEAEPETGDDLPAFLKDKPEDAQNWTNLRGIAKDAQKAAKEAVEARHALEVEKARLEAEVAAMRAAQTAPPPPTPAVAPQLPDPDTDPGGYARALVQQETERLRDQQLNAFEGQAIRVHGKELVDKAFAWAAQRSQVDPAFAAQMSHVTMTSDPFDFSVREMRRQEALAQMGDDPTAYIEAREAAAVEAALAKFRQEAGQATQAQVDAEIAKRLPKSLAKAPGVGGAQVSQAPTGDPTPMAAILDKTTPR